jgi:exopolysaccharide biosynthesis polyprenyl glycosylphosphotransferase
VVVHETGRVAAVAVPVVAYVLVTAGGDWTSRGIAAAVQCLVWTTGIAIGHALGGPALTALGPRVAIGRGVVIGALDSAAVSAWLPDQRLSFGGTLALAALVFVVAAGWETLALRVVAPRVRLLLVGASASALTLLDDIRSGRGGGYEAIGVVQDVEPPERSYGGVPVLGGVAQLDAAIAAQRPDLVVLAPGPTRPNAFPRFLDAAEAGFRVVDLAEFYEYAYGRVPVEDLPREWFMSVLHLYQRPYSRFAKRTLDVAGALVLLVLTLPLFPLLALFVRQTEGPIVLRQVRLGEHGRRFTIYKFRTMRADAEVPGQAVWASEHDPRLTRTGGIMRRLRLDELPQLWNVLRGDMSLVGPRPERPEFLEELSAQVPFWTRRHLVKPGLTGWAQVRQGYAASAQATAYKLSYDFWYLRHRSLTVDLAVLLRTAAAVLAGERPRRAFRAGEPVAPGVLPAAVDPYE